MRPAAASAAQVHAGRAEGRGWGGLGWEGVQTEEEVVVVVYEVWGW